MQKNKIFLLTFFLFCISFKIFADDDTGSISVSVLPSSLSNVSVYVDGSYKGTAPCTVNNLKQGNHTVRVSKFGYSDDSASVYVSSGRTSYVTLQIPVASIAVETLNVSGASVYVDGSYKGTTPLTVRDLAPGTHNLKIEKTHYQTITESIYLPRDTITTVTRSMIKISGYLTVTANPSNASVFVGGARISGRTELDEGHYNVRVRLFGYDDFSTSIVIERNKEHRIQANLKKAVFKINNFSSKTEQFSPDSAKSGSIYFTWSVTAPENAQLVVRDKDDSVVWSANTHFTTWEQYIEWDGKVNGAIIPDGKYSATLTAASLTSTSEFEISSNRTASKINAELSQARIQIQKEMEGKVTTTPSVDYSIYQEGRSGLFVDTAFLSGSVFKAFYLAAEYDFTWSSPFWNYVFIGADLGVAFAGVPASYQAEKNSFVLFDAHGLAGLTYSIKKVRLYFDVGLGAYVLTAGLGGFSSEFELGAEYKIGNFSVGVFYELKGYVSSGWADVVGLQVGYRF